MKLDYRMEQEPRLHLKDWFGLRIFCFVVVILGCLDAVFWREFNTSSMPVLSPALVFGNKTNNCVVWIREVFSDCGVGDPMRFNFSCFWSSNGGLFPNFFSNFCFLFPTTHRSITQLSRSDYSFTYNIFAIFSFVLFLWFSCDTFHGQNTNTHAGDNV